MERRPGSKGVFPILPTGAQPCVWMLAGVLTYRLCDRNYDCERCTLDAGIRGVEPVARREASGARVLPSAWDLRDDRRYRPAGGWVLANDEGRLRWGVDGLVARLLDRLTSVVLPASETEVKQGEIACWLEDEGELIPLRAPVSGRVVRTNQAVQQAPGLITTSPYDDGWLVELRGANALSDQPGLCDAAARRESATHQMAKLQEAAVRYIEDADKVGLTAADGGERITDLRRMLGTRRYHRLILSLLR